MPETYPAEVLPPGVRSRFVANGNGLDVHVLEAGYEAPGRPLVLLLHGFPELAFSWRKVMPALVEAGFRVVAPDQRGFGSTTGWDDRYDTDLRLFAMLNLVRDAVGLVAALGYREVAAVVGHDSGAGVAGWCAVARPDVFRSVVTMSAPFGGPAPWPAPANSETPRATGDIHADLAALDPPRKHYQWYYSTREANDDMQHAPQGVHDFLRAYYHHKSADWAGNRPFPLASWTASQVARMPAYYVMRLDQTMAETVAEEMPSPAQVEANAWLPDADLRVYSAQYGRTGFQGGLNWYRCGTSGLNASELALFAGRTVDVPSMFVAGAQDWGIHQRPGSMERMAQQATDFRGIHLVEGAGHWVQQEQHAEVARLLLDFLDRP